MTDSLNTIENFSNIYLYIFLGIVFVAIASDCIHHFGIDTKYNRLRHSRAISSILILSSVLYLWYLLHFSFVQEISQSHDQAMTPIAKQVYLESLKYIDSETQPVLLKVTRHSDGFFQSLLLIFASIFSFSLKIILDTKENKQPLLMLELFTMVLSTVCIFVTLTMFQWNSVLTDPVRDIMSTAYSNIFTIFYVWWAILIMAAGCYYLFARASDNETS